MNFRESGLGVVSVWINIVRRAAWEERAKEKERGWRKTRMEGREKVSGWL